VAATIDPSAEATLDELVAVQRDRLLRKLAAQRAHAAELWGWYHGEQDYPVVPSKYRDQYRLLFELARTPWARLVVDTIAERLHVMGFRSGAPATDAEAWRLFKGSSMDADERLVYTEALVTGTGYLSVSGDGAMAPESVFEVTHEPAPGNRRQVAAAIKVYPLEPTLQEWALELYRPDATYRWATVLVEPYKAAVDRLWVSDNPESKFGTFEASDLGQYLRAIEACVAALCAISRVPAHYLMQSNLANPPTAESLVSSESGLVAKVRERQRRFGEAWERATALELEATGAPAPALEVVWQDAEMRNPAQVADAATKLMTIGVPQRALFEYVGATPQQIAEWSLESAAAELVALATAPTPPSNGAGAGPPA
jgi:hypothetical protein